MAPENEVLKKAEAQIAYSIKGFKGFYETIKSSELQSVLKIPLENGKIYFKSSGPA
jgi:hypothetical protein